MAALILTACGAETIVHGVSEREANYIIEVLADKGVTANKIANTSGREVTYDLSVSAGRRIDAIKALNKHELPRRKARGYADVFSDSGLIPTSSEEKAKKLAALEGEIERQLKVIDGVLDVEVQIVTPDESALRTTREQEPPTTASVTMKCLPRADGEPPISESEVQKIVAAGVEKLSPENVVFVMRLVGSLARVAPPKPGPILGARFSPKTMNIIVIAVGALLGVLLLALIFSQLQLRSVRGRLVRLQNEIAKARKKSADALQVSPDAS